MNENKNTNEIKDKNDEMPIFNNNENYKWRHANI